MKEAHDTDNLRPNLEVER